jgi:HSF-type DNA-binding
MIAVAVQGCPRESLRENSLTFFFQITARQQLFKMGTSQTNLVSLSSSVRPAITVFQQQPTRSLSLDWSTIDGKKTKRAPSLFPSKLRRLLDDAVDEGNEHLISWLPGGTAFKIHNPVAIYEQILPRYFRQSRFKSFTRQL